MSGFDDLVNLGSLGIGSLTIPNYGGSILDQYPVSESATGNSAWDGFLNMGGNASPVLDGGGGDNYLYNLLNGNASLPRWFGAGLGALAGALDGSSKPAGNITLTKDVPAWLKPYYLDLFAKGQAQTQQAPGDYSQSDAFLKSIMAGTANPYLNPNNRYFDEALTRAQSDTASRVNGQFRNNAFGGGVNQDLLDRNLGDQANSMRFGQRRNVQDLYGQELNRATNVATGMPQYQAQKTQANFQPLSNQRSLYDSTGAQASSPYYSSKVGGSLYGGLLGTQLFGGE